MSRMKSAHRLRVLDTPRHTAGAAHAEIELSVQSIEFPSSVAGGNPEEQQDLYLRTTFLFYQLLLDNHADSQDRLKSYLRDNYEASAIEVRDSGLGISVSMTYNAQKLMTLQCDQSSGELAVQLGRMVLVPEVRRALNNVQNIVLSVDVTNHRSGGGGGEKHK